MPQLTKRTANCFILEIGLGTSAGSSLNSTDIRTGRYQCFYKMLSRTGISFRFPKKLWYKIIESIVRHWQITEPYSETYSWIGDASVIADRYIISYLPEPTPIEMAKKKINKCRLRIFNIQNFLESRNIKDQFFNHNRDGINAKYYWLMWHIIGSDHECVRDRAQSRKKVISYAVPQFHAAAMKS